MVVSFGELLIDMVSAAADVSLQDAPGFIKAPGGAPANVAVGLARLGVPSRFVGQVGDDPFGHWLRGIVANEGVDVSCLSLSPTARTTIAFVATRSDGRKDICFYRNPGADAELRPADLPAGLLDGAKVFHCGSVSLSLNPCREAQLHAVKMAKERGILVSYDPNWRPSLWPDHAAARETLWSMVQHSDLVKVADEEWEFFTGTTDWDAGGAKILDQGPRLVVITRGGEGAHFIHRGGSGAVAGFPVDAIDTLGAGDSFVAGLIYRILQRGGLDDLSDAELSDMLRFANGCGALATLKNGAIPALPTLAEVEAFLTTN